MKPFVKEEYFPSSLNTSWEKTLSAKTVKSTSSNLQEEPSDDRAVWDPEGGRDAWRGTGSLESLRVRMWFRDGVHCLHGLPAWRDAFLLAGEHR